MTRSERGTAAVEMVSLVPVIMLFFLLVIAAGRLAGAHNAVEAAASGAARAASIERDSGSATSAGQAVAASTLANEYCTPQVSIEGNFDSPAGTPATVTAHVSCTVQLGDLLIPGIPGSRVLTSTGESVIDTYRGR